MVHLPKTSCNQKKVDLRFSSYLEVETIRSCPQVLTIFHFEARDVSRAPHPTHAQDKNEKWSTLATPCTIVSTQLKVNKTIGYLLAPRNARASFATSVSVNFFFLLLYISIALSS